MDITETFHAANREEWRGWLEVNHATAREIWLVRAKGQPSILYLHAVEEALCFGWIDGIAKTLDAERTGQRFTPRRPKGNWTELNKERARRLIAAGKMTPAGYATLPDLALTPLVIAPDILAALQADALTWANFEQFPDYYRRIRIAALEDLRRDPAAFQTQLANLVKKTAQNKQFPILI